MQPAAEATDPIQTCASRSPGGCKRELSPGIANCETRRLKPLETRMAMMLCDPAAGCGRIIRIYFRCLQRCLFRLKQLLHWGRECFTHRPDIRCAQHFDMKKVHHLNFQATVGRCAFATAEFLQSLHQRLLKRNPLAEAAKPL